MAWQPASPAAREPATRRHAPEQALDKALLALWPGCTALNAPVMAHSGHSMGSNDDLEAMAGPVGYRLLIDNMGVNPPARVHLGPSAATPASFRGPATLPG